MDKQMLIIITLTCILIAIFFTGYIINMGLSLSRDYDCSNFKTQKEAQSFFDKLEDDKYRLDRDNNKIACENLN